MVSAVRQIFPSHLLRRSPFRFLNCTSLPSFGFAFSSTDLSFKVESPVDYWLVEGALALHFSSWQEGALLGKNASFANSLRVELAREH